MLCGSFQQILEAAALKTTVVRSPCSNLTSHSIKTGQPQEKKGRDHKRHSLLDTSMLADKKKKTYNYPCLNDLPRAMADRGRIVKEKAKVLREVWQT